MLLSPRNSLEASRHVLEKSGCAKFVYSVERERQVNELRRADSSIQAWTIPDLWDVFTNDDVSPYAAKEKQPEGAEDEVAVIIHSSGTTGTLENCRTLGWLVIVYSFPMLTIPRLAKASTTYAWIRRRT